MAYTITHIIIADMVLEYLPQIEDYSTYILGTIASDAVHANQNYSAKLKERSHLFTPDLVWGKIDDWTKAEKWMQNIRDYYHRNQSIYPRDFLWGYVVHLFADVYNSMYFYTPFVQSIKDDNEGAKKIYKEESFGISHYLFGEYSKSKNLLEILRAGKAVTLDGVIEQADVEKRIEDLFEGEFMQKEIDVSAYRICTIESMEQLAQGAANFVKEKIAEL